MDLDQEKGASWMKENSEHGIMEGILEMNLCSGIQTTKKVKTGQTTRDG